MDKDTELIERARNGDIAAFKELVTEHKRNVYYLAYDLTRCREDAEDVSQEVFIKAYNSLKNFRGDAKFGSWLYRITVNESINFEKRNKKVEQISENLRSVNYDPDKIYDNNALSDVITDALMELDMLYRMPVVLKHFLDYSYKELSYLLGVPEKTVKSRLFTGRQLLKDLLVKKRVL